MKKRNVRDNSTKSFLSWRNLKMTDWISHLCLHLQSTHPQFLLKCLIRQRSHQQQARVVSSILSLTQLLLLNFTITRTRIRVTSFLLKISKRTRWSLIPKASLVVTKRVTILKVQSYSIKLWDLIINYLDQFLKWMDLLTLSHMSGMFSGAHQTASLTCMKA
jgi:hypothetical protein